MAEPAIVLPRAGVDGRIGPASRLDAALARMAGRLALVVDGLGRSQAAGFLSGLPGAGSPAAPDGGCLDPPWTAPEPIDRMVAALGLRPGEVDLLVLALLADHHEGVAAVLRDLHPQALPCATVGLAGTMAESGLLAGTSARSQVRERLAGGPLTSAGLLRIEGDDLPFPERGLRPAPGLGDVLAGRPTLPAGLVEDPVPLPGKGFEGWLADPTVTAATASVRDRLAVTVHLAGGRPRALTARLVALVLAAGGTPAPLRAARLDTGVVSAALLTAAARGVVPVLWSDDADPEAALAPAVASLPVPLLVCTPGTSFATWPRPLLALPSGPHRVEDRLAALGAALPELAAPTAPLGPATIEPSDVARAASDVRLRAALTRRPPTWEQVRDRIDELSQDAVPAGARLLHPRAGWDDLVLVPDRIAQLREAVERMRHQARVLDGWGLTAGRPGARGLRMLFAGPPGTGKSLAAEVVAADLGRDLLVVDLSQLVSKWIGETEKNLAAVFDAAESGGCAILFDEADALFGRRTEVGDARDRYANLETAYLLTRLERFSGIAFLATNLRQNLDPAFARRIEFVVTFDPPDAAARLALWRAHLPDGVPLDPDVDLAVLAALYELPGALIRNAALAASFLAAARAGDGDAAIGVADLAHAVRREHTKAGLPYPGPPSAPNSDPTTRGGTS